LASRLLQIVEYTIGYLRAFSGLRPSPRADRTPVFQARPERQHVLYRAPSNCEPSSTSPFCFGVGDNSVMDAQLGRLIEVLRLLNVTLRYFC